MVGSISAVVLGPCAGDLRSLRVEMASSSSLREVRCSGVEIFFGLFMARGRGTRCSGTYGRLLGSSMDVNSLILEPLPSSVGVET